MADHGAIRHTVKPFLAARQRAKRFLDCSPSEIDTPDKRMSAAKRWHVALMAFGESRKVIVTRRKIDWKFHLTLLSWLMYDTVSFRKLRHLRRAGFVTSRFSFLRLTTDLIGLHFGFKDHTPFVVVAVYILP